jgi:hypothetical protein
MLQHIESKNAVKFIIRELRRELRGPRLIQVYGVLPDRRIAGICMLVDGCNIHAASRKRLSDRGAAPPAYVQYSRISQKEADSVCNDAATWANVWQYIYTETLAGCRISDRRIIQIASICI